MRKQKVIGRMIYLALAVLIGIQVVPVRAFESPDQTHTTEVDTGGATLNQIAAMKEQIEKQQKQIEAPQMSIEAQKAAVQQAVNVIEADKAAEGTGGASIKDAALVRTSPAALANAMPVASEAQASSQTTASATAASPQAVELPAILKAFKPIGTFYLSYQAGNRYSGTPNQKSGYNSFQLKRGYFGAEVEITPHLTTRFVSDITADSTGDVKLRAKYIYGKFHWKGDNFITGPYVEFGLAHMPWLDFEEALNGFRMQDTMFIERSGILNSADVGVLVGSDFGGSLSSEYKSKVNSHYAGKYGSWQVGIFNGGGYHAAEQNTNKVFEGRLTFRPIPSALPGLQFSVFGVIGKGNKPASNGTNPPDWKSFDGMVSYESRFLTLTGQGYFGIGNQAGSALEANGIAAHQRGFSVFAGAHIPTPHFGEKITILGRVDEFNSNTRIYNDLQHRYIAGIAWHFYKSNILLFDYQRTNHSISYIPGEDRVQITLQITF